MRPSRNASSWATFREKVTVKRSSTKADMETQGFQMMQSLCLLVLLMSLSGHTYANEIAEEGEIIYSSASSLHDSEDNGPYKSRHLILDAMDINAPLAVMQPTDDVVEESDAGAPLVIIQPTEEVVEKSEKSAPLVVFEPTAEVVEKSVEGAPMVIIQPTEEVAEKSEEGAPLVIIQPTEEVAEKSEGAPVVMIQPTDVRVENSGQGIIQDIVKLIETISEEETSKPTSRQAKQMNIGATSRIRSLFNIPFYHGQGFIPRSPLGGNIFHGINSNSPGWQQMFKNTFSNLFSFGRPNQMLPYGGIAPAASKNNPAFVPYPQYAHAGYNPYLQQAAHAPNVWAQYQPQPQFPVEDLSNSASYGQPARLPLGSTFNPYQVPHQQVGPIQFGSDLAMSGSGLLPHQAAAQAANFGRYVSTVPKHTPLFENAGGIKGASLEMSNAFADFADSHEHGPEVTQKFGSVGHTINTFLGMMGLGGHGDIMPGNEGGFGGAGGYASMDSAPISRSSDFYPGYGNQAVLEDMEDYPIFQEDITREYLKKMNLTHLLDYIAIHEEVESPDNENSEATYLENTTEGPAASKDTSPKYMVKEVISTETHNPQLKEIFSFVKDSMVHDEPWYAPLDYIDNQKVAEPQTKDKNEENKELITEQEVHKEFTSIENTKPIIVSNTKKPWLINGKPKVPEPSEKESPSTNDPNIPPKEADAIPSVNYKVPPTHAPVSPKDRIQPVATFQGFPERSNPDKKAPEPIHDNISTFQGFPERSNADYKAPEPTKGQTVPTFQGFPQRSNPAAKAPEPPKYAPAQSIPHQEFEENLNQLIDENVPRSWVAISSGLGYVEKRPKSSAHEINSEEIPKGMSIVHQMLSGISPNESLQE
ncbi:hypothetical protein JTE90_028030 [Oedothorax gibbosus]|uniref:Uncharacterized protein n=1 Tax=Oedothorax gibbosus TaxID=931172 RepID=A0AAV6TWC1_9ARAC|nr:hypothetical protein JTE90_028030 [Oedothorax gibbosus]